MLPFAVKPKLKIIIFSILFNGFNLALAYAYKAQIHDHDEEVKFRISLALWLRKQIESLEKLDWQ